MNVDFLTESSKLLDFTKELEFETAIAVDLESDALHNYREKVCLMQISTPSKTVLIDTLAIKNLSCLKPVLSNREITKIFHAADYDLRCLKRDFGLNIYGLFDTMICAQLIGEDRIGLADLLKKFFDIELDKKHQKADWSLRPLPKAMVDYAAADTAYLHQLKEVLSKQLEKLGRSAWQAEECSLIESVRFKENVGPLCLRFKGASSLSPRGLGVLECLLCWREGEGARFNKPVYKILSNRILLDLARHMPNNAMALRDIDGLSKRLIERHGAALLEAIDKGTKVPFENLPVIPKKTRKTKDPRRDSHYKALKKWRENQAEEYALAPGVLINNETLEAIAEVNPMTQPDLSIIPGLKNWQINEFGKDIITVLKASGDS